MKINENLANENYSDGITLKDKESGYQYFPIANLSDLDLEDGKTYIVSFVMEQSEKGCGKFNAGPLTPPPTKLLDRTTYEIKDRASFKFTCDKSTQGSIAVYTDLIERKAGVGATLKYVKIEEEGGDLVYIPSMSSLEPSKQPLLPPEGDYKEIQPQ